MHKYDGQRIRVSGQAYTAQFRYSFRGQDFYMVSLQNGPEHGWASGAELDACADIIRPEPTPEDVRREMESEAAEARRQVNRYGRVVCL